MVTTYERVQGGERRRKAAESEGERKGKREGEMGKEREIFKELVYIVVEDGLRSVGQANKMKFQVRVDITVLS